MNSIFKLTPGLRLFLASASPRRSHLLGSLAIPFIVAPASAPEPRPLPGENPGEYACRSARAKGQALRPEPESGLMDIVLAADTIVMIDNDILGKPVNTDDALRMLRLLNGRVHQVITAVYLRKGGIETVSPCLTTVSFGQWPDAILMAYALSGEPLDKAGAYAIQDTGTFLVEKIEGSWTNVAGLPLAEVTSLLLANGIILPA